MVTQSPEASPAPSAFLRRLEARYRPSSGAMFLEDQTTMVRLPLVNSVSVIANALLIATLLFTNDEAEVAWTAVALAGAYLLAVIAFIITGRAGVYIHAALWPSLVQNLAVHVMLGGFIWSGATLFWGITNSVIAALFLGRRTGTILAGAYVVAAVFFAFLEPTLQSRRSQPELAVSVGMAVDVFVISVLILIPIVMTLMGQITRERNRSESLLRNVLPGPIAQRLKQTRRVIADAHPECTVLFADIVGFTDHATRVSPERLLNELNQIFSRFDALVEDCGAEKIKTMGDGYLAVAGAPIQRPDHASVMCELALLMQAEMPSINSELGLSLQLRVGLHTGPLVAGVVGNSRLSYDLWGETVNLASRMEASSPAGAIQATDAVVQAAGGDYLFDRHGISDVKGVGPVATCLLAGRSQVDAPPGATVFEGRPIREAP